MFELKIKTLRRMIIEASGRVNEKTSIERSEIKICGEKLKRYRHIEDIENTMEW